jgi:hypothetical protein
LLVPKSSTISTPTTNSLVILKPSINTFFTLIAELNSWRIKSSQWAT